jgi:hypothetical protein
MQSDNMMQDVQFLSVRQLAKRWGFSEDKTSRELEKYRGKEGFTDWGSHGSRFRRKRAIIRIHPSLADKIELDRNP